MTKQVRKFEEIECPIHAAPRPRLARVLVVIDPTSKEQPGLEKAARIALGCGALLELFICEASVDLSEAEHEARLERSLSMLEDLAAGLRARGLQVECRSDRHAPLEQGVALHVIRTAPDLVVKDTHRHALAPMRGALSLTDWTLIRLCAVPLLLVRPEPWTNAPLFSVSLDPCHPAVRPEALDESMLALGMTLAAALRGSLDALHVLQTPPHLPGEKVSPSARAMAHERARDTVTRVVTRSNDSGTPIPLHFLVGRVADSVAGFAVTHDCDVLVMGAGARARWPSAGPSGTAAQVLETLPCDLLVVKPPGFVSPLLVTDDEE